MKNAVAQRSLTKNIVLTTSGRRPDPRRQVMRWKSVAMQSGTRTVKPHLSCSCVHISRRFVMYRANTRPIMKYTKITASACGTDG